MRSIVCRIRKKYFDAVLRGDKEVEWRKDSEYWRARLDRYVEIPNPGLIIVLICGKRVHRRKVRIIYKLPTPTWFSEQGKKDVPTPYAYAISMGDEVKLCQCVCGCQNIVEDPMQSCCNYCNDGWCEGQ